MIFQILFCLIPLTSAVPSAWFQCGKSKYKDAGDLELPAPSIVGGIEARPHEFPWQVNLQKILWSEYAQFCGGSIINDRWVLTAAHCTRSVKPEKLKLVFGDHAKLNSSGANRQTMFAEKIVIHPKHNDPVELAHDFSLVKTEKPIHLNENVWPVCAPEPKDLYAHRKAVVSGWGMLSAGLDSNTLRYATLNITTNEYCSDKYSNKHNVTEDMVCATDNKNNTERDACIGDSGGPLVVKDSKGIFTLVGLVSWGIGCASKYPGVYARVNYVLDWINETINKY